MKISQNCLDIIKEFEGYEPEAYLDPVGIPTIGYGTIRYPNGQKVKLGDKISKAEADAFLQADVNETVDSLNIIVKGITLNQNQFDAVVSLCYNIGTGGFQNSTVLREIKNGNFQKATAGFDLWNKGTKDGKKVVLAGLVRRRAAERALFEKAGKGSTPLETPESPQDKVTRLEGYRDGDNNVIVALADDKVVEILVLKSKIKEDLISTLQQYKNARDFQFAPAGQQIPAGDRIEVDNKLQDIPKTGNKPTLENRLLIFGMEDDEQGGNDVRELQARLTDLGYYLRTVDGVFGKATDESVRNFQADVFGIAEADGKVGPKTWGKLWGDDAAPPPPVTGTLEPGKTYLLLTKTAVKDTSGCFKLKLEYIKDGQTSGFLPVISGQPKHQVFRTGKTSPVGTCEPLPEGKWFINDIQWAGGKDIYSEKVIWQSGIGPAKILLDYVPKTGTRRQFIEIHIDWNRSTLPGTAGCIGIGSISEFKTLVAWLRDTNPRDLYVDWGLGSVKLP